VRRWPRGLAAALAVSAALHGVLLAGWLLRPAHLAGPLTMAVSALHVRVVEAAAANATPPFATDTMAQPSPPVPNRAPVRAAEALPAKRSLSDSGPTALSARPAPATPTPPSLPPAPDYRGASGLDPPPVPLGDIEPVYPDAAGQQEGVVVIRLLINEQGGVDEVGIVRATPQGLFEASAVQAFGQARFSPGRWLGVPVKCQLTIEVHFAPINRGAAVSGRSY
jgi:TonB family protein